LCLQGFQNSFPTLFERLNAFLQLGILSVLLYAVSTLTLTLKFYAELLVLLLKSANFLF